MKRTITSLGRLLSKSEKEKVNGGYIEKPKHPCCHKPRVCECPKENDLEEI
ncbi:hypothetical protein [Tenacibaculum aiptasiae]|uniref:hypothetical protein n=1 Tax=Tenacibaculum aiptasiae TaxID=426481 RepID=UPI0015880543|nr:hypothetical protein [Tenacibaculum aiptasiae]